MLRVFQFTDEYVYVNMCSYMNVCIYWYTNKHTRFAHMFIMLCIQCWPFYVYDVDFVFFVNVSICLGCFCPWLTFQTLYWPSYYHSLINLYYYLWAPIGNDYLRCIWYPCLLQWWPILTVSNYTLRTVLMAIILCSYIHVCQYITTQCC